MLTGHPETSSTGSIIWPVSGQFDDFSSGDNSLEKMLPEETDKNLEMEKNDSGIAEEIDSESSSTYGFSNGDVHKKDNVNFIAISNVSYEDNGNVQDSEEEKGERVENEGEETNITDLEQLLIYQDEKQKEKAEYPLKEDIHKEMTVTEEKMRKADEL